MYAIRVGEKRGGEKEKRGKKGGEEKRREEKKAEGEAWEFLPLLTDL